MTLENGEVRESEDQNREDPRPSRRVHDVLRDDGERDAENTDHDPLDQRRVPISQSSASGSVEEPTEYSE